MPCANARERHTVSRNVEVDHAVDGLAIDRVEHAPPVDPHIEVRITKDRRVSNRIGPFRHFLNGRSVRGTEDAELFTGALHP